jgi:hypothetical protein
MNADQKLSDATLVLSVFICVDLRPDLYVEKPFDADQSG